MKLFSLITSLLISVQVFAGTYQCQVLYTKENVTEFKLVTSLKSKVFTMKSAGILDPTGREVVIFNIDGQEVPVRVFAIKAKESNAGSFVKGKNVVDLSVYMEMEDTDTQETLELEGISRVLEKMNYVSVTSIKRVETATEDNWRAPTFYHTLRLECKQ